jgi:subtilase family serine protease
VRLRRGMIAGLATPLLAVGAAAALPATAGAAASRVPVPAASAKALHGATRLRAATDSSRVAVRVYLAPRGGLAALEAAATAVSTPGSATYRHFLTPALFKARYAAPPASAAAVSAWLTRNGLAVSRVEGARRYVAATGTTAQADRAFGTALARYKARSETFRAPSKAVTAPAAIAGDVLAVSGLSTRTHVMKPSRVQPPAVYVNARPCSTWYGQIEARTQADFRTPLPKWEGAYRDYAPCGYTPTQFRSAYEGATSLTGAGRTVAIVDAYGADTIEQDANTYARRHGDAAFAAGQFSQSVASPFTNEDECDPSGWAGEETLDVEAVHGMAPAANVRYYGAASCEDQDLADTLDQLVDDNQADLVSNSYGDPGEQDQNPSTIVAFEQPILQGALQGISFMFSSGDSGDEVADTGIPQADYPASEPYVTAVGGTSTAIDEDGALAWQTGWGTSKLTLSADGRSWKPNGFLYGSGGGYSSLFNRPAYQSGVVPETALAGRAVPDVAMDADPTTGMLVGETQTFPSGAEAYGEYRIGGTSLASPLLAGYGALLLEANGGKRLGLLNPLIYGEAKAHPEEFSDVTSDHDYDANVRPDYVNGVDASDGTTYSLRTFDDDSGLDTAPGWDPVTGIGSPNPSVLSRLAPAG